ncbi:MAG: rod shape-determining protein MreD [Acidobacteria bacterium]|nr:rod shape-determining protein MreD [Acidobacteriota bacterium]|tara:strand:- start:1784 stop:2311 length:528 start_codon:yes stop_codon:yes gene_type:complete
MRAAQVGVALAFALASQTTLVSRMTGAATVDLVLVVVLGVAMRQGAVAGLWTGTVGGLLQDALSGGVVGVGGLAKTLVGYFVGRFASQFDVDRLWQQVMVFFFGSLLHAGVFVGIYSLLSDAAMLSSYAAALTQAGANAAIGVGAGLALAAVPSVEERQRRRKRRLERRFGRRAH